MHDQEEADQSSNLGLGLEELTPSARREMDIPSDVQGLVVTEVDPGKPAGRAGLQQGDIIVKFGDRDVSDIQSFREALRSAPKDKPVLLLVRRGDGQIFLGLRIGS